MSLVTGGIWLQVVFGYSSPLISGVYLLLMVFGYRCLWLQEVFGYRFLWSEVVFSYRWSLVTSRSGLCLQVQLVFGYRWSLVGKWFGYKRSLATDGLWKN